MRRRKVLVIDDEPQICQLIVRLLEEECEVVCASEGAEGLRQFNRANDEGAPFDLVLCDVTMPRMNGWEVFAAMRPMLGKTAFVTITGGAADERSLRALRALERSAVRILPKPFSAAQLRGLVGELVPA